jgi:hypothetical protein
LIDFTASQAQASAEQARPFRQPILVDTDQGGRVMRHDGHPRLDDCAAMAFVGEAPGSPAQQTSDNTFDHGAAVPTRVGEAYLGLGPDVVQVRLLQAPENVLRRRRWGAEERPSWGSPPSESPVHAMPPAGGVIDRQIAGQRVDGRGGARPDPGHRLLYFVDQGLHIAGITRIARGQMPGKDKARGGLGNNARFTAELGRTVAFALANGGNGGIVRIDDLAVSQGLALRQPAGLVFDPAMRLERGHELGFQTPRLFFQQLRCAVQACVGGLGQRQHLRAQLQQLRLRLAYQCHKDLPHSPALATKAAHHPLEAVLEAVLESLGSFLEGRPLGGALRGDDRNDLEDFLW